MGIQSSNRKRLGATRMSKHVLQSIQAIVTYLWDDEFQDYTSRTKTERNGHVFRDLLIVRRFLKKNDVEINKIHS